MYRSDGAIRDVIAVFLKLGAIGFGGPAAHIAMMEEECVQKRKWLDRKHFLDIAGLTNLVPGPNSTEMAIHLGYLRAGWGGLVLGGLCFLAPAILITLLIAWAYAEADLTAWTAGIKPAVMAVILGAGYRLGKKAVTKPVHYALGAAVITAVLLRVPPVLALLGGTLLGTLVLRQPKPGQAHMLGPIFVTFLTVGSVLYGSGYVLVAFLENDLVHAKGWLTQEQLLDAIAVGQFTPGPVLCTATFIGFQLHGVAGALVATAGIFLPSFLFVSMLGPLAKRIRHAERAKPFLEAVRVCAVALIAAVLVQLCVDQLRSWQAILIAALAAVAALRYSLGAMWVVTGGAFAGWMIM